MAETCEQLTIADAIINLKQRRQRLFEESRRLSHLYGWPKCTTACIAIGMRLKMIDDQLRALGVDTRRESIDG